jgi:hypothetical protein
MADNLKTLKANLDLAINPNAPIGGIKAQKHNDYATEMINKLGKFTGVFFTVKGGAGTTCLAGEMYINAPLNQITNFDLVVSRFNGDGNNIESLFNTLAINDSIHIKDDEGRSSYFTFNSLVLGTDSSSNPIITVSVKGLASNPNYTYLATDSNTTAIEFFKKTYSPPALADAQGDALFTKQIVAKADGTLGIESKQKINFGTIFLSSSGNDTTAIYEDAGKPYLTLNAAMTAFFAQPTSTTIQIISSGTFSATNDLNNGTNKELSISSVFSNVLNITSNTLGFATQKITFNTPNATINFNPTTSGGFANEIVNINCNILEFGVTYSTLLGNSSVCNILCSVLNIRTTTGIFAGSGGARAINIKASTLNFRGANARLTGNFMHLTLDFDNLTHDNTFSINGQSSTKTIIYHGNVSSIAPYTNATNIQYIQFGNCQIFYKGVVTISSNLSLSRFNVPAGDAILTGTVNYTNSSQLIANRNNVNGLKFINANITVNQLIGGINLTNLIEFVNCVFNITGSTFISYTESGIGIVYSTPTATFKGSNYIFVPTNDSNIVALDTTWVSANNPTWDVKDGVLLTNGLIPVGVDIVRRALNQYNSTTIIP